MLKNLLLGLLVVITAIIITRYYMMKSELLIGDSAPELTFQSRTGQSYSLTDFNDQYVLMSFWGSWCAPCRTSNKKLVQFYKKQDPGKIQIISIGIEKNLDDWNKAIKEDSLFWDEQFTPLQMFDNKIATRYQVDKTPTYFLINPDQIIVAKSGSIDDIIRRYRDMVLIDEICPKKWTKISLAEG